MRESAVVKKSKSSIRAFSIPLKVVRSWRGIQQKYDLVVVVFPPGSCKEKLRERRLCLEGRRNHIAQFVERCYSTEVANRKIKEHKIGIFMCM